MSILGDLADVVSRMSSSVSAIARAAARVPRIDESLDRLRRRYLGSVVIRRTRNERDLDLSAALDLYERRIPANQRVESADIVAWVAERKDTDCFLIAKFKKKVCGFTVFHCYPRFRRGMFSYMVVDKGRGLPSDIADCLMRKTFRLLKSKPFASAECFLMEVDDPRQRSPKERSMMLARIRRFSRLAAVGGFTLRAIDIDYKQPPLTHQPSASQDTMLLLVAARRNTDRTTLPKKEVVQLLRFIYTEVYPDGYSTDQDQCRLYAQVCASRCEELNGQLAETVNTLRVSELS
jgi:hypothetical protein